MHNFILKHRTKEIQFELTGFASTREVARTKLLIFNLAETDFSVWELSE